MTAGDGRHHESMAKACSERTRGKLHSCLKPSPKRADRKRGAPPWRIDGPGNGRAFPREPCGTAKPNKDESLSYRTAARRPPVRRVHASGVAGDAEKAEHGSPQRHREHRERHRDRMPDALRECGGSPPQRGGFSSRRGAGMKPRVACSPWRAHEETPANGGGRSRLRGVQFRRAGLSSPPSWPPWPWRRRGCPRT